MAEKVNIEVGVVSRPHPSEVNNGDGYFIKEFGNKILFSVIDGLGHGDGAHKATEKAKSALESLYSRGLVNIIESLHQRVRSTRGVVIGLLLLDLENSELHYVGIGNITVKVLAGEKIGLLSYNGIVGQNVRKIKEFVSPYKPSYVIIMHSDGIRSRFDQDNLQLDLPAQELASHIESEYGRSNDDATIMVIKIK